MALIGRELANVLFDWESLHRGADGTGSVHRTLYGPTCGLEGSTCIMGVSLQFLVIACYSFLMPCTSCPVTCRCTAAVRPSVDCSYRDLIHVPVDLPISLKQLSLSVNYISGLNATSFANVLKVTSLWLSYNKITAIQPGTFENLTHLMSLDLSHNQLFDFPWNDLSTLEELQLLNLNNNHLVSISAKAFTKSKNLRSLQLSNNRLYSLPEGILEPLSSLSHLQLHANVFNCSCSLSWLIDWIKKVQAIVDRKGEVTCFYPSELRGITLEKVPDLQCRKPLEIMNDKPVVDTTLLLCKEVGVQYVIVNPQNKGESYSETEVVIKKFANGSIAVRPSKQSMVYICHVANHTEGNAEGIPVSLVHYKMLGWPNVPTGKLLLLDMSGRFQSQIHKVNPLPSF
ncbi:immunoglobulin superfamily containing leucine-rich repeat protein 2-like [Gastrophryne carolinensis]